jgi:L-ribulose-5-phosphate 4-epimerase
MSEEDLKREVCRVMAEIVSLGLTTAYGGNVSALVPGKASVWITPSGLFKGSLNPRLLVKASLSGEVVEGETKPSRELRMHLLLYRARGDVGAVVHCHPRFATALGIAGRTISPVSIEAAMLGMVPLVPYSTPGGERLARAISRAASRGANTVLLRNHGVLAVGPSLESALRRVQTLEDAAKTMFIAEQFGKVSTIGGHEVKRLLGMGVV